MKQTGFNDRLNKYLEGIESEFGNIPAARLGTLNLISDYIGSSTRENRQASLIFICTHNSRRSQFGQAWAATAAEYYGKGNILSFSGGTESTAFNPRAAAALERAGFSVRQLDNTEDNPRYELRMGGGWGPLIMFSKKYDQDPNPSSAFCAIMVCSDADEACPIISGAAERISLPYEDPKAFDGTELETEKYDERCREIARDLFYVFSRVAGDTNHHSD